MASHQVKVQQDAREYIRLSFPSFFAQKYFGKKQYYISFGVKADPPIWRKPIKLEINYKKI